MKIILLSIVLMIIISGCNTNSDPGVVDVGDRIDYSCNVDSDCEVKDVGNHCGYYPQCVNKNFQPNPPELDSVVCGYGSINTCNCIENRCEGFNI